MTRGSLCRRAVPQAGQATWSAIAALTCSLTILSCSPESRSLASSKESPRVPGAKGPRSRSNTSWTTVGASLSASILTNTVTFILHAPRRPRAERVRG